MGLCPSDNVTGGFPTLGDPPFGIEGRDQALAELQVAGLPRGSSIVTLCERLVLKPESKRSNLARAGIHVGGDGTDDTEWVELYTVEAEAHGWKFYRAWYYWVAEVQCSDAAVDTIKAQQFNEQWGKRARVNGYAGGQDPTGPVDYYHIDTPEGLAALVETLAER